MTAFLITFRETLEAALVAGIVLSYLSQLKAKDWFSTVYYAIFFGILFSIVAGYIFEIFFGGFEGTAEELYEGVIMLVAAALISWMILWMLKARHTISKQIRSQVDHHMMNEKKLGVFFLVFIGVLREGIETVLFLKASSLQAGENSVALAVLGIVVAVFFGYLLFAGLKKLSLQKFFTITSVLLILFAAGLTAHGVHELQEAKVISIGTEEVWNVNPTVNADGSFPLLHEKGTLGSLAKGLFGWNGNPTLLEVFSYFIYLLLVALLWKMQTRRDF